MSSPSESQTRTTFGLLILFCFCPANHISPSANIAEAQSVSPYTLRIPVDEVSFTFHAADVHGLSITDLKLDELSLLDNGKPPRRLLALYPLQGHPIRAGILIDTSESMEKDLSGNRAIAIKATQRMLRQTSDQAFVMDFGYTWKIAQQWTSDPAALASGIRNIVAGRANPLGGTALFDAIFRTCLYDFGDIDHTASGNFILLFSDGEDNSSHSSAQETIKICQRSNTAIYAFRAEPRPGFYSSGPGNLAQLAAQTGGRVFPGPSSDDEVDHDLRAIESDLRNQYRIVFKPAEWQQDGSFHRIQLTVPERVERLTIPSGYYALLK
jgi:Ca-activated chloride channel family protein